MTIPPAVGAPDRQPSTSPVRAEVDDVPDHVDLSGLFLAGALTVWSLLVAVPLLGVWLALGLVLTFVILAAGSMFALTRM